MVTPAAPTGALRVAIDGRYLDKPGIGIHNYVLGLIDLLVDGDVQVTVLSNRPRRSELDLRVDWIAFGSPRNILWDQIDLPRHFANHDYDVYWAPANNGIPLVGPRPERTVMTIHDLVPILQPVDHILRRPLYGLPWVASVVAGALRADTVTTVSRYSADRIRRWLRRRSVVIPPAAARRPVPRSVPPPSHPDLEGRYVVYNGGFGSRKRVDTLLRAMAELPASLTDLRLVALGRHMEQYRSLIAELGIADQVIAPGYVSEDERDAWVEHAWAMAYPSSMEGFGLPLLEAMSYGVPVVTSANSSLSEVGGDAALYAAPDEPAEWTRAFEKLDDDGERDIRRARGLEQVERYRHVDLAGLVAAAIRGGGRDRAPGRAESIRP